jgi:hypothetical protein
MNMDVLLIYPLDSKWALICYEMDIVAPLGELNTKACCEYTTTADSRITTYSNLHVSKPPTDRVFRKVE